MVDVEVRRGVADLVGGGAGWSVGVDEGGVWEVGGGGVSKELVEVGVEPASGVAVALIFDVADELPGAVNAEAEVGVESDPVFGVEEEVVGAGLVGELLVGGAEGGS